MPDKQIELQHKDFKRHIFSIWILLIIVLFFAFLGCISALAYYIENPSSLSTTTTTIIPTVALDNSAYAKLDSHTCRSENEYSNELTIDSDRDAYSRTDYYTFNLNPQDVLTKISAKETLYAELIRFEDDSKDSLIYHGKALVCIKGQNKIATISFDTNNTKFKDPVRYKDPERSIKNILIQAIYIVPSDAKAKANWSQRIENNLKNIQAAQKRIFDNKSNIDYRIYPEVVAEGNLTRDFLTRIAKGIVTKDKNNEIALTPVNFLEKYLYTTANLDRYPSFRASDADLKTYNQVSTLVYFETGSNDIRNQYKSSNESGYAFINPALDNGNFFGIIGTNLSRDISIESAAYHEFMHTLGLPDEYKYKDGSLQRSPTHLFKGTKQTAATLMEDPGQLNLNNTYIDDEERVLMGV